MKFIFLWVFITAPLVRAEGDFFPRKFKDIEGQLGGAIPFPPQSFMKALIQLDPDSQIDASILPHGRSLERSITDFTQPRSVMVWQTNRSSSPFHLYFAYTPRAEQLEIIAWDWEQRKYDFGIVSNYAPGKKPIARMGLQVLCISCHQSKSPIFPAFPWNETPNSFFIKNELKNKAQDVLSPFLMKLSKRPDNPLRLETSSFDFSVSRANQFLQSQNICKEACGGNLECRKGILLAALLESSARTAIDLPEPFLAKMNKAMQVFWPQEGFGFINSVIPDRNPSFSSPFEFLPSEDPLPWREKVLSHSPSEGTSRNMLTRYQHCWSFKPTEVSQLRSWKTETLVAAMNTEQVSLLVQAWLPQEQDILLSLESAISAPWPVQSPEEIDWTPVPKPSPISDPHRPKKDTGELFTLYCAGCHQNSTNRPPRLPLDNLTALRNYKAQGDRTVKALIDPAHPLMPPPGAYQPTLEERLQMFKSME